MKTIKIKLKIQSISDIITNSSSEVFCSISTEDESLRETIFNLLKTILPGDDGEYSPTVRINNSWDYETMKEDTSKKVIEIQLPYSHYDCVDFYKEGVLAILEKHFGKDNYTIDFEDE